MQLETYIVCIILLIFYELFACLFRESLLEIDEEKDETDSSSVVLSRCK